jgi:cytochrome c-type biogenesis protein CcmH/NrfG
MPEMSERIAELRRELESNPLSRQFYQLGELLRRDGRAGEAIAVLRGGLGHHPRYVAAWVSLGRACLDRTEPKAAADALHEALELDAQNPVAWRLLGEARLGGGDRFGALDAMEHALQLAPGDDVLRAAVDALASETWPPEAATPASGAATPNAVPPAAVASAPPTVLPERIVVEAEEPHAAAMAPAAPEVKPFAGALAPAAPSLVAPGLADPFALPLSMSATEAAADVFAMPVEAASFADEPFGSAAAPASAQAAFLAEFAPFEPIALPTVAVAAVAAPAVPAVFPAEPAPAGPTPVEIAAPVESEVESEPAAAVARADEVSAAATPAAAPIAELFDEAESDAAPVEAISTEPATLVAPWAGPVSAPARTAEAWPAVTPAAAAGRPTLTMARLHLQQQDFPAAIAILERLVTADPENQEARDLLDLVHDMMAPLPGELPLASVRERRIAALQGWLASLTLGQERVGR